MNGVRIVNDLVRAGRFGEPMLWSILADRLELESVDFASTGTTSWPWLKDECWKMPRPRLCIQNATWAEPCTGGNVPYIALLQDDLIGMYNDPVPQWPTLNAAHVIVCNGPLIASHYVEHAAKIRIIPLGIDQTFWNCDPRQEGTRPGVVFVGEGAPHKGFESVKAIAQQRTDLEWTWVVKSVAAGAPGRILRNVSREVVREALRAADVFILGSPVETQCLAALEAMACGLPVVMPATGCFHDWRPPSFFEAHPQDCKLFSDALDRALASRHDLDPRRDLLAAGRFTVEDMVSSWRALLTEVLANLA